MIKLFKNGNIRFKLDRIDFENLKDKRYIMGESYEEKFRGMLAFLVNEILFEVDTTIVGEPCILNYNLMGYYLYCANTGYIGLITNKDVELAEMGKTVDIKMHKPDDYEAEMLHQYLG